MSDKEIGLVQIRTGKQRNLPKALEHGELALTTDECRMFVGLPSAVTPASLVAGRTAAEVPGSGWENVEVLTEFTPSHVLNRVLYKPVKVSVPGADSATINIPSADRVFVDYIAYQEANDGSQLILETGSFQIVSVVIGGTTPQTLVSQINNTNDSGGITRISIDDDPSVNGSITSVTINNGNASRMTVEYIYRGWNASS